VPAATVAENTTFFGLAEEPLRDVFDLNLLGTALPSQVFGEAMTRGQGPEAEGSIVNVSSMAAQKPLTRVAGYSAAKAALENFTRWLAVEVAQKYGPGLRDNAIAPASFSARRTGRC
jgi:NAD(P)-dependent dehydrogenase (short-subunit alcohol dehydrogenase family)